LQRIDHILVNPRRHEKCIKSAEHGKENQEQREPPAAFPDQFQNIDMVVDNPFDFFHISRSFLRTLFAHNEFVSSATFGAIRYQRACEKMRNHFLHALLD
jgi:hypothetical protein